MTDENLSKRERQKLRRQAKVEAQRAQQRAARRRRLLALGLVVVVVLAGVGVVVANQVGQRRAAAARAAEVAARLDELGCTPIEHEDDFGGGQHLSGQALASNPPEQLYNRLPASAGPHMPQVAASGAYEETVDERLVVHNLEHGYVAFWWDPDADQEVIDAVTAFVEDNIDRYPKLIAAPYNADLPDEQAVTTVAWTYRQECAQFDPDVALTFLDDHYGLAGDAPEKNLSPHSVGDQGVLDPADTDGPLLFPPLDQAADASPSEAAGTEPAESEPAADATSPS